MTSTASTTSQSFVTSARVPPGPAGHPLFGNLAALNGDMTQFLLATSRDHGHTSRIRILPKWYGYLFTHPEHYKHILVTKNAIYDKSTREFAVLSALIGQSVVIVNGPYWRQQRKLALPALRRERVVEFAKVMVRRAERLADDWVAKAKAGVPVDIENEMTQLTVGIAAETLLGEDLGDRAPRIGHLFSAANHYIAKRFVKPFSPWSIHLPKPWNREFNSTMSELKGIIDDIIRHRRSSGRPPDADLLGLFLNATDEQTKLPLTDVQIRDEALTYLFAGHETGSTALTWIFYLLSKYPEAEAKLHAELDQKLTAASPTIEDLNQLTYTKYVFDESLRLFPPGYVMSRRALEDDEISGYFIPRHTQVFLSPYVTHLDPEFWDRPEEFDPDRFSPERSKGRHLFAYIPFGFGPRRCIGTGFATAEVPLILSVLARRFSLRIVPGHRVEIVPMVTIRPRNGLPMVIHQRNRE